jgi:hypothetical protein
MIMLAESFSGKGGRRRRFLCNEESCGTGIGRVLNTLGSNVLLAENRRSKLAGLLHLCGDRGNLKRPERNHLET